MKMRLKGAQKGHSLLKKKADALTLRFRQILTKIIEVYSSVYNIARLCIALVWCVLMVNQDTTDIGAWWGAAIILLYG